MAALVPAITHAMTLRRERGERWRTAVDELRATLRRERDLADCGFSSTVRFDDVLAGFAWRRRRALREAIAAYEKADAQREQEPVYGRWHYTNPEARKAAIDAIAALLN